MSYAVNTELQQTSSSVAHLLTYPLVTFAIVGTVVSVVTWNPVFYIPVGLVCALGGMANFISEALSNNN